METFFESADLDKTNLKPLYALEGWTGNNMYLFEAGSPSSFYFYSPIESSLHMIIGLDNLAGIVEWLNDDDKGGYSSILTEQVV